MIRLEWCACQGEPTRVLRDGLSLLLCRDCGLLTVERPTRAGDAARLHAVPREAR